MTCGTCGHEYHNGKCAECACANLLERHVIVKASVLQLVRSGPQLELPLPAPEPPKLVLKRGVTPFFRWFDLWIGAYWDAKNRALYLCPLPMVGLKVQF